MICYECPDKGDNVKEQMILMPTNFSRIFTNGIIVSESGGLEMNTCTHINNKNYYVLITQVTESENITCNHPIAMISVSSISNGLSGNT